MSSRKNQAEPLLPSKGGILLFSYAFPPMQVQMSPTVFKPIAAIARRLQGGCVMIQHIVWPMLVTINRNSEDGFGEMM